MRLLTSPRLLLPLIMFFGVLILGLRVGDIWDVVSSGKLIAPSTRPAYAEAAADSAAAPATAPVVTPPALAGGDRPAATATTATAAPEADQSPAAEKDAADLSPAEIDVLKQLSSRREQLDKRSHDLDQREALLKVAEQRVDQKIKEMEGLRSQLQGMVGQVNEQQAAQLDNLVKIYETMKPEDAAHIFENLDMPTLLSVVRRMKPKSTAPIMAKMEPSKAKELTIALTKQDQLPAVK